MRLPMLFHIRERFTTEAFALDSIMKTRRSFSTQTEAYGSEFVITPEEASISNAAAQPVFGDAPTERLS